MKNFVTWMFSALLGGLLGWALSRFGMFASFMGGLVGTALGLFLGRWLARNYGG
jgi:hypothetical protein